MSQQSADPAAIDGDLVGSRVRRREDARHVTGESEYTHDLEYPRQTHMAIVRSQYGSATIEEIETGEAASLDGVLGVYTDADLQASGIEGLLPTDDPDDGVSPEYPILARNEVHYQGQPIAAVVAEDPVVASDAAAAVAIDYDRRDAVTGVAEALDDDAPAVHEAAPDNVAMRGSVGDPDAVADAFDAAARIVECDLESNRVLPTSLEPRATVARYAPGTDTLSVELSHQKPHRVHRDIADMLELPTHRVRVRVPDVGGAFGAKNIQYSGSVLAAWCAMHLERPVKWRATRTEDYTSMIHAREQAATMTAALDDDGRFLGLRVDLRANVGAYLPYGGARVPMNAAGMITGPYDVPAVHVDVTGVFTNTTPLSTYRGAGRPVAAYFLERLVDAAAREIEGDPVTFRRRNYVAPDDFPYEAPEYTYEQGEYDRALSRALDEIGYESLRQRQADLRDEGRYLGVGVSSYVDRCGGRAGDWEGGLIRVSPSGTVTAYVGTKDNGHGHATTFAQVVADELGVPFDDVEVVDGDTDRVPQGRGTGGSRSASMGGNALRRCAQEIVEKARRFAAHEFEVSPEDVAFDDGEFSVRGVPEKAVHIQDLASDAFTGDLPDDLEPGLEETTYFSPSGRTFPYGTHVAVVEVDPQTGEVDLERFFAVDDCGVRLNPPLVEGQIHGGVAQALGQALYENAVYDETGTLVTGSLQDYAVPRTIHLPDIETDAVVTPAPNNPLGVKGVGESGTIGATASVVNAIVDALEPLGVEDVDIPATPERVWQAVRDARADAE